MKGGAVKLLAVVIGLNIFFAYIGLYFLPQSESQPPKTVKIEKGITQEELVSIGEEIIFSKGQCMVCHPMQAETGMRAPAIATIGSEMDKNAKEKNMTPEAYAFEGLVNPDATVAKGFEKMMPPVHKAPTSLTEGELIAVAAFLQSKGAKVTISFPDSVPALQEQIAREAKQGGS
ncbi:MAG: c-type cytochrome [Candidatus Magnetobacterium sp. LHC-1]|uniref:C-type cytochrome n=1 Tax=Candidatus Magnetobacterium casense TaxID=1455061 RepID=A0ABS6RW82_9BACT|nr:c-type cytochrome [Candidatus Magnetobacterium casensis]MBF0607647.1 c-type cytochrome [Nitrospirota bacterium]MBV6340053.1 c-type cytochrome [Candidatus Magnetobacterium casensis]